MTNPEEEMRKAVAECTVTKIHGQPTNQDIDRLDDELTAIASSFPSELGGGLHGHAGLVKSAADYDLFAPGTPFLTPANPGVGILPQGYARNVPLPRLPLNQSTSQLTPVLETGHQVPTYTDIRRNARSTKAATCR